MADEHKQPVRWDFGAPDMERLLGEVRDHKGESLWQDAWRRLKRNRSAFWSMIFLALFAGTSLFAPLLPLASPVALSLRTEASPPSWPWESPPPTTAETPKGAAVTSSFGAVMDNGWRHRSVASFETRGGTVDEVSAALATLVEDVSGRSMVIDRRSSESAGAPTGYHVAVSYDPDDPPRTDWEPTGAQGSVVFARLGDSSAWMFFELPEDAPDLAGYDTWGVENQDRDGALVLRGAGDDLLRYAFRLPDSFAGTFEGITVNGRQAPPSGRTSEDGVLGQGALGMPDLTLDLVQQEGPGTQLLDLGDLDEDTTVVSEAGGARQVLFERTELPLNEQRGLVHADLERRLRTALEDFVPPTGATIELTEVRSENGYWELGSLDVAMIGLRAKVFGLWQTGNWLGTDSKGRDILARIVWGSRTSLLVAIVATLCSLIIGVTYGAFSGLMGGRIDNLMMRFVDILYSLPFIFVVIFLITIMNEYRTELVDNFGLDREVVFYLVIGAIYWLTMARVVRGQVLSLKNSEFIEAARVIGAGTPRILFAHLVPNVLSIVIVYLTLTIPAVMLFEAFLSFLGLGIEPPKVSWGTLAVDGTEAVNPVKIYWWLVLFPAAAMGSTLLALNVLGDGLRDALDPKLRGKD